MTIPTPVKGQPLDVSLMYNIVSEINSLSSQINNKSSSYAWIQKEPIEGQAQVRITEVKMETKSKSYSGTVAKNALISQEFSLSDGFAGTPVVMCSLSILSGSSDTVKGAQVYVTEVSSSKVIVEAKIPSNGSGQVNFIFSILAIGTAVTTS
jgi:hypothetical protein